LIKTCLTTSEDETVIERKIQTEAYWQEYAITDQDLEELSVLFLENERPMTAAEMAQSLVASHCRREENLVRRQLERGAVYRPNGAFAVGEELVFPHLDFKVGTVRGQRKGHNPEYGEFSVITVEFEGNGDGQALAGGLVPAGGRPRVRSFAAELQVPHKLAVPDDQPMEAYFALSVEDLNARYGDLIAERLEERLRSEPEFLGFRGRWLPSSLGVDLHVGHLNIAEAMIDIRGEPLPTGDLLDELDLPAEIPESIKVFCLGRALSEDDRFDDVGDTDGPAWSLCRWEPDAVLSPPARLQYQPVRYGRTGLDVTHLQLEREIDDDASFLIAPPTAADASSVTILLGYPHWREGTLPLTDRTRVLFPKGSQDQHTLITFVNHSSGEPSFPGWVVHSHRYVYGLQEWYKVNKVLPGAYVKLQRAEDAGADNVHPRVVIEVLPRRMQREWVHVAFSADGELAFRLQKRPIACEYDELCVLDEQRRQEIDDLWEKEAARDRPLDDLVRKVFVDLVKLSSNGMVHSKTVYSAVNVVRRCPPGLVFAILFRLPEFVTAGDGYWIYQGSDDLT
jgi:hypothetical protein